MPSRRGWIRGASLSVALALTLSGAGVAAAGGRTSDADPIADRDASSARSSTRPIVSSPHVRAVGTWSRGHALVEAGPARRSAAPLAPWRGHGAGTTYSFDAIAGDGTHFPARPTGALGVDHIVTAVDTSYALYDLTGAAVIGPNPLGTLLPLAPGAVVVDPKVVYDQYAGRFVIAYLAVDDADHRSWLYLVSIPDATATDPTTWCGARVVADRTARDGAQLADDPGLGYDVERVVVSMDMYDASDRFRGATVLAFPKRRLYDCSQRLAYDTFTGRETKSATGRRGSTLQPAVTVGDGRAVYLTSLEPGRSPFLVLWRLSGEAGSMSLRSVALRVPRLRAAPLGTQGGADVTDRDAWWDTGDLRVVSSFADLDAGRVYAAHTAARDLGPESGAGYVESVVRWYELDPAGTLGASRVARIGTIGTPQTDAGWPSLATDVDGNLFVTYSRASAVTGEFLSAWIAEVEPGAKTASTAPLEVGTATFDAFPGPERWGDSSAMSRDPVDGRFVMAVNQVAVDDGSGTTREWRQVVHVISHTP